MADLLKEIFGILFQILLISVQFKSLILQNESSIEPYT